MMCIKSRVILVCMDMIKEGKVKFRLSNFDTKDALKVVVYPMYTGGFSVGAVH